jgi:hypothetical protein
MGAVIATGRDDDMSIAPPIRVTDVQSATRELGAQSPSIVIIPMPEPENRTGLAWGAGAEPLCEPLFASAQRSADRTSTEITMPLREEFVLCEAERRTGCAP